MRSRLAAAVAGLLCTAGCGGVAATPAATPPGVSGPISVFAAASLTEAFKAVQPAFEKIYPKASVQLNFAGTPTLLTQIQQGAFADVLASADLPNMQKAVDGGLVTGTPQVFTRNQLAIVVPAGNPKHVSGLPDLARPDVLFIAAAPNVPAGQYGVQALAKAGVKATPRSLETDVKAVVAKVSLGEADAGIVYVTDVKAAGAKVMGVAIPTDQNVVASYPVAALKDAKNPEGARAFVDFLLSVGGQKLLSDFGFAPL